MADLWFIDISPFTRAHGMAIKMKRQIISLETPYQRMDIFESYDFGKVLVLDGIIQLTEADEFIYHELLTHVPMLTHVAPKQVLIIGGGDGCCLREVLKHGVEQVTLVDIDEEVVKACKTYLRLDGGVFDNLRVEVIIEDAAKYIRECSKRFDVIISDATDAPCEASKPLLTPEFYQACYHALRADGIFVTQGGALLLNKQTVRETQEKLKALFPITRIYTGWVPSFSGCWPFVLASKYYDPIEPRSFEIPTRYYSYEEHKNAFIIPRWIGL